MWQRDKLLSRNLVMEMVGNLKQQIDILKKSADLDRANHIKELQAIRSELRLMFQLTEAKTPAEFVFQLRHGFPRPNPEHWAMAVKIAGSRGWKLVDPATGHDASISRE